MDDTHAMKAYADTEEVRDTPRMTMEVGSLEAQIEKTSALVERLMGRLSSVMVPGGGERVHALDGVPTREPSPLCASIVAARDRVQRITAQVDDMLQRLEI